MVIGPILLQSNRGRQHDVLAPWDELPSHPDEDQIQLDVNRSFVYYPSGQFHVHKKVYD